MRSEIARFVAWRYTTSARHGSLVSFIARLSMLGLVLGVALLIVVLSIMNGFDRELRQRILQVVPQVTLFATRDGLEWREEQQRLETQPGVLAAAPYLRFEGLLVNGAEVATVLGYAIDPVSEARVSALPDYVVAGDLGRLDRQVDGLAISRELAQRLGVGVDDALMLVLPQARDDGRPVPRLQRMRVAALFDTGTEIDQALVLAALPGIDTLLARQGRVDGLRLHVEDLFAAPGIAAQLQLALAGDYLVGDWTRSYGNLYHAIQLSKRLVSVLVFLIVAVAAFNVVATLVLVVGEKQGDIAILRTLGASPAQVTRVFLIQGGLIGLLGAGAGAALGSLVALFLPDLVMRLEALLAIDLLQSDVYPVSYLPSQLKLRDVLLVAGAGFVMSLLATLYPAQRASRLQPADVLRYD